MDRRHFLGGAAAFIGAALAARALPATDSRDRGTLRLDAAQWRQRLTPAQFHILRERGTEPPGSSPLDAEYGAGVYHCAGCAQPLYSSTTKFHSGTGWPSFWKPLPHAVTTHPDRSQFMTRTEVRCRRCDGHLGHVFRDGPPPTGLRYCMNGLALDFHRGERA
jgi:peptide-methionine (R)-S-oxide reductase